MGTDVRFGVRMLLRSPGFAVAAILCLALGIGATTAIFSVVNAVLLRPLPYAAPEQLVRVYTEFPNFPGGGLKRFWVSPPEFFDLRREAKAWQSLEGWSNGAANLGGISEPVRVTVSYVTGGMLSMLGVPPANGRLLTPQDDALGAPQTVVLSHGLWQRALGGDPATLGREIRLDGQTCTVVGVMPPGFHFPPGEVDPPEAWAPLQLDPKSTRRGSHFVSMLGRVRDGLTPAQARSELERLTAQWGAQSSQKFHQLHPKDHPLLAFPFHEEVVGSVRPALYAMLAAVGFVLLIACVNVANLLLARAEARQREVAIRKATGASMGDLLRQFVVEGLLLAGGGALLGLVVAWGGLKLLLRASLESLPRATEIGVDWRVLAFTTLIAAATGMLFGLAPLAQVARQTLHDTLKSAASRTTATVEANRLRRAMVVAELALALVLLIGTGLMLRAFWRLQAVDLGIQPRNLLTMRVALPQGSYPDVNQLAPFWTRLQDRLEALPGVTGVTLMSGVPPVRQLNANDTEIEGFVPRPGGPAQNIAYYQLVGRRFFETMGARLVEGRWFDERDGADATPVVIVNQSMARAYYPGQSALGRRIRPSGPQSPWRTIVGVVGDIKNGGIDKPTGTEIFGPYRQLGPSGLRSATVVLRTVTDPMGMVGAARAAVTEMDSSLPVAQVRTMEDVVQAAQSRPRFLAMLLSLFAGVALALAAVGIYGVVSYSVSRRTGEIGIRMAMGAQAGDVLGLVLWQGVALGLVGVAVGALGAFWLTRFLRGLLFSVDSFDPATFAGMAFLLVAVTLVACLVPALRATRVDPMVALRYE